MCKPILCVRLAIHRRLLNVYVLITGVEIDVANRRFITGDLVCDLVVMGKRVSTYLRRTKVIEGHHSI